MSKEICECCRKLPARMGVRLRPGWAQVCGGCADHIAEFRELTNSPGVILESKAAQAAFDAAFRTGMTIADAMAIAEPVEAEGRRERYRRCVKLGIAQPVGRWYAAQPA